MTMNNWKYLINRIIIILGMIGSFMGATLGYSKVLLESIGIDLFIVVMTVELVGLILIFFLLLIVIIDFIKDNKKGRE